MSGYVVTLILIRITVQTIITAIKDLRKNKSDGSIGLSSNHLLHGPQRALVCIALLFSSLLRHGHTPHDLLMSVIIPIPKNVRGNLGSSNNYRGISLCSPILKLLEIVIAQKYNDYFETSYLQFAFKSEHSSVMCASIFKEVATYYLSRDTDLYCCFLDATKAFDRLKFTNLFNLLYKRNLPPVVLRLLYDMYIRQQICVSWNGVKSDTFSATNGVRQGGIISPLLFNIYLDVLLNILREKGTGCHIGSNFIGCLAYADDVVIMAPTLHGLQDMLDTCSEFGTKYGVLYNTKKTLCMRISKDNTENTEFNVTLNDSKLMWVSKVKYLGIYVRSDLNDTDDMQAKRSEFFVSLNSLLGNFKSLPSNILYNLFSYYCMSFYGAQTWNFRNKHIDCVCKAFNRGLRTVWRLPFNAHTKIVLALSKCSPLLLQLERRFLKMYTCMAKSTNVLVQFVASRCHYDHLCFLGNNISLLCEKYNLRLVSSYIQNAITYVHSNDNYIVAVTLNEFINVRDGVSDMDIFSKADVLEFINALVVD